MIVLGIAFRLSSDGMRVAYDMMSAIVLWPSSEARIVTLVVSFWRIENVNYCFARLSMAF